MRTLLGSLPFLATALWSAVFYLNTSWGFRSWRWSLALGCVLLGAFSLILTESLSALHLLSFPPVVMTWSIFTGLPAILLLRRQGGANPATVVARLRSKISALSVPLWAFIIMAGAFALILVMGVVTPPMNFDVQMYHLPRQIYWMMQGSVENFDATYPFQISHPVLSEYLGLNLLLLSGGDSWHNLVQTLFFVAACGVSTLIAKSLGSKFRGQIFAVLFVILVPVTFFEASNAKNDIVLSLFVLLPLLIGIRLWTRTWKASVPLLLLAALSAGLALATKGTAIAYLPASAFLIAAACLRLGKIRILLLSAIPGLLLVILPTLPNEIRNFHHFHSFTGPGLGMINRQQNPIEIAGIALKTLANQYAFGPETWIRELETITRHGLVLLGLNADDTSTNLCGAPLHFIYFEGMEDVIPAPVQTTLVLLLPLCLFMTSFRSATGRVPLFCVLAGSLLLFCIFFLWQPWGGRLLIPAYFMAAPLIGMAEDFLMPRWLPIFLTALELLMLKPQLIFSGQRPLLGGASIFRISKQEQMSRMMPGRATEIQKAVSYLKESGAQTILVDGKQTEIYGLLRAIHADLPLVNLVSGHANRPIGTDAIVESSMELAGVPPPPMDLNPPSPSGYKTAWIGSYYRIFLPIRN